MHARPSLLLYCFVPLSLCATAASLPTATLLQPVTASAVAGGCTPGGVCLEVTVARTNPADPQACGTSSSVTAEVGQSLTWCYTLTNNSDQTLNWHSLADDLAGSVFSQLNAPVAAGATYRHVRVRNAGSVVNSAVNATWTASSQRPSYQFDDSAPFNYLDATDGQALPMVGGFANTRTSPITLPFTFTYFGVTSNKLCVGQNGAVEFGAGSCVLPYVFGMPAVYGSAVIAPAWTELVDSTGTVYAKTIGEVPGSRKVVIQWHGVALAWPTVVPGLDFELVLDEADGTLTFLYQSMGDTGNDGDRSVVGLQPDRLSALVYSSFQPQLDAGKAVRWTPVLPSALSASASATVDIGAAQLMLPIPQLTAFAGAGISVTQPLLVINSGNRELTWNAGEYPQRHLPVPVSRRTAGAPIRSATARRPAHRVVPTPATHSSRSIAGAASVPAWGLERIAGARRDYVRLDLLQATAPSTVLESLSPQLSISGLDFVGNDFSRQFAIDWRSNTLYTINPQTGTTQTVGQSFPGGVVQGEGWMGIAWDPASDQLFAVSVSEACGWSGLYTLDMASAAARYVGPVVTGANVCLTDIAFDQNGQLYGIDISEDALVRIDKSNGIAELVGSLGLDAEYEQSLKFDRASGALYWGAFVDEQGAVARIDPTTGVPTVLGPTHDFHQLNPMAIATAGGDCAQPVDLPWLRLSTTSGSLAPNSPPAFIDVDFDATHLQGGVYQATICVFSNDPAFRVAPKTVPVTFTVQAEAPLFGNGFED